MAYPEIESSQPMHRPVVGVDLLRVAEVLVGQEVDGGGVKLLEMGRTVLRLGGVEAAEAEEVDDEGHESGDDETANALHDRESFQMK